jgi:hypothetical protein
MSGLFGGGPAQTPDYTGLQIQTAVNTLPIPIVWGESKIAPNVVWYNDFQTDNGGGKGGGTGKGGLFSSGSSEATYSASVILALCEGPITGINQVWKNESVYSLSELGLSLFTGTTPQGEWSYLETSYPSQALAYQGTAYIAGENYQLGDTATLANHNFEVQGVFYGTGGNGLDADPAKIVNDFLTNPQYGIAAPTGFPGSAIDATTLFGSGGDASYQTYCKAVGLSLSPALTDQEQASSILARWLQLTNTAAVWSGGQLKFIPYGDTATTAGTHITVTQEREVGEVPSGSSNPAGITVCIWSDFVADGGVTYSNSGTALAYIGPNIWPTATGTYSIAYVAGTTTLSGTYLFAEGDEGTNVEITFTYKVAASFVPNVTPIYDLDDDDYKIENNEDPLQVTRSDPYEAYNVWRLEVADRDNAYNLTTVESRDQNAIELYGMRIAPTVTAHEICDTNVGLISGQLMLQRAVYIRNTYKFRLSWEYCLLDPMDLVTVTDSVLGLSQAAVRITEIEEDENGFLSVTAEEFPLGVATATLYATQPVTNAPINTNVGCDAVNTPIIFEPPSASVGSTPQVWIAASGGAGGAADPNWGGCNVFLSTDGTSYTQIGTINGPATMGALTASLPNYPAGNPDTTDTLAVNLAESGGTLSSVSNLDASLANTLCIADSELVSYATATLTGTDEYALTYLYRGLYGTSVASHFSGAPFAFLNNNAIFKYDLPAQYVGVELYLKFQSFNVFGGGLQELSSCTPYTYTPSGTAFAHPVAEAMLLGSPLNFGLVTGTVAVEDDFGTPFALAVEFDVDLGVA